MGDNPSEQATMVWFTETTIAILGLIEEISIIELSVRTQNMLNCQTTTTVLLRHYFLKKN